MQKWITPDEVRAAAQHLAKSQDGRIATTQLLEWLESEAPDLSLLNQRAFLALLGAVWSGRCEETRTVIRETLARETPTSSREA